MVETVGAVPHPMEPDGKGMDVELDAVCREASETTLGLIEGIMRDGGSVVLVSAGSIACVSEVQLFNSASVREIQKRSSVHFTTMVIYYLV